MTIIQSGNSIQRLTRASLKFAAIKFMYLGVFDFFGIPVSFMFSVSV
jgi:hypothetical protein